MKTVSWLFCLFLVLSATGCATHQAVSQERDLQKQNALTLDLLSLHSAVKRESALTVARTAIQFSRQQADRYRISGSPRYHNLLINLGLKERGLCFHWTDDLLDKMQDIKSEQFYFHSAIAHRGSNLREHSSVVVTFKGESFETGIVLDGWRYSGDLYWSRVKEDSYAWQPRYPERASRER